jgi:hypothetical protein
LALTLATILAISPSAGAEPEIVPASECTVEPLETAQLVDIVASPVAEVSNEAESSPTDVDQATIDEIIAVVRMSVACANANDLLRSFALFSDRYLQERFGSEHPDDLGHGLVAITRESSPAVEADQLALVAVDEVTQLDDTHVTAVVTTANADFTFVDRITFVKLAAGWKIDRVELGTPAPDATPAP